jgi:hypothetical protein
MKSGTTVLTSGQIDTVSNHLVANCGFNGDVFLDHIWIALPIYAGIKKPAQLVPKRVQNLPRFSCIFRAPAS